MVSALDNLNTARVDHRDALRHAIEGRLHAQSAAVSAALTRAGVPAGVVTDVAGAFALAPHLGLARVVRAPREDGTTISLTRNPIELSVPPTYRSAPPPLAGADAERRPVSSSTESR